MTNIAKKRILIVVDEYPQISQTYIKNELDELVKHYEIEILALTPGNYPFRSRHPHMVITEKNKMGVLSYLKSFAPDVVHVHYFHMANFASKIASFLKVPYTVRNHSFDVTGVNHEKLKPTADLVNRDECLGILSFPYTHKVLVDAGVKPEKIHACFPVLNYSRFNDESRNGDAVMNVGAAIPKKSMVDYIRLSSLVPERKFNLYAMGYKVQELTEMNREMKGSVNFVPPIEPEDMLSHYKQHEWLVYTASSEIKTVGWPMAIAEAQSSGVGVCMQNIRPDIIDYIGDAGFVFNSPEEAAEIIRKPFPSKMRELGFKLSKRSDIASHIGILTKLWN